MLSTNSAIEEYVILVNEQNEMLGVAEKLTAHKESLLHRAFSIFIFNSHDELLLQRRALTKYHSPGLWSNTCCGHPRPAEQLITDARHRLRTEMGLDCELNEIGSFIYRAELDRGLIENEFDHVLIGHSEEQPVANPEEAMDAKWMSFRLLEEEIHARPEQYTFWLKVIIGSHLNDFKFPLRWL